VAIFRIIILAGLFVAPAFGRGAVIHAGGAWAAIDYGGVCEVRARSARVAPKGKVQAIASFAFSPDRKRWGEFAARLSRMPRPGSSVLLAIGSQQFLLVSRGATAWSRGPAQEQAIIAAARTGQSLRIETRDQAGRRYRDDYSLAGAPTAIDAAAARCAGKMQRQ
jgi:hypothetical protein